MTEPVNKKRELGQVFTPAWMVEKILDEIGFTTENPSITTARILEPSVGEGVFLQEAVRRIIGASRAAGADDKEIAEHLAHNVVGVDIDSSVIELCSTNLNAVLDEMSFAEPVEWNVFTSDALTYSPEERFDYVVGNPPYIRVHNMPPKLRESVKRFKSSTGTTDLYIIFYELGLSWLNDTGKLGYIAPNSWLKNTSQKGFRKLLINNRHLSKIVDYGSFPVFEDADTYTAVAILNKVPQGSFAYSANDSRDTEGVVSVVSYDQTEGYKGEPLVFNSEGLVSAAQGIKIQDICKVQNGICTLGDKFFLNPPDAEEGIVRPVVRGSRYKGGEITETILFPYESTEQENSPLLNISAPMPTMFPMSEERLADFPKAEAHLRKNKEALTKRTSDKNALWFHYGRSQAIKTLTQPKLCLSIVISPSVATLSTYELDEQTVVNRGLFITKKTGSPYSLKDVQGVIESPEFIAYARACGKDMSGGYKEISSRMVNDFIIPQRFLIGE